MLPSDSSSDSSSDHGLSDLPRRAGVSDRATRLPEDEPRRAGGDDRRLAFNPLGAMGTVGYVRFPFVNLDNSYRDSYNARYENAVRGRKPNQLRRETP